MDVDELVDRLASMPGFDSVPRAEIAWLHAHGRARECPAETRYREAGDVIDHMSILLAGRVGLYAATGGGWRKVFDATPGYVIGAIPYSRMRTAPGNLVIEDAAAFFELHREHFPGLVSECPELTAALVHHMIDRARDFRSVELHDERMQALGRLAAGLAHELNNPASAAARSARSLAELLREEESAARYLMAGRLTDDQLRAVDSLRGACSRAAGMRGPLDLADREEAFSDWMIRHDIDPAGAEVLATSEVSTAALDELASVLPPDALAATIRWFTSAAAVREIAGQIGSATGRIHDLVAAVKGFTFMDRETVPDEVDVARGLAHTVAMLESKSRAKAVRVRIDTAVDIPHVFGFGSELNQVWEKLIDNAIDAVGREGTVTITATSRGDQVLVRVMDDGAGIAEENRARVFEPFFTTKPVGQGTGLGLDIARRFVHLHHGDIHFTSQPGRTVFRVRLPVTGAMAGRGARHQ